MLDGIQAAEMLKGVRGGEAVNRDALAAVIVGVSELVSDFPEISEMDLNPVFATAQGAVAADVRIVVDFHQKPARYRPAEADVVTSMNRIMQPKAVAVIGASDETGKIDTAVFAIPAKLVAGALIECGEKKIAGAILIPSGFAETGNHEGQDELVAIGRKYNIRMMGPNIYGFYYTPANLCATFCTAYDVKGSTALSSQSGGIGMAIIGFSRSAKMGVSAIVGLGNKSDIDEDDLLLFFEQDPNTKVIAQHCEDLKDGRAFAEVAKRVSKKKPVIMLKAGRTSLGAAAASSHTGALAGNDKIYDDVLKLLKPMPADLDAAFRKFIPPFGAAGNPVDITGGEPPITYMNTVRLGLEDERIHALILGYWHTIVTPPMVFARNMVQVIEEMKAKGIVKPVVASLAGDVEVEEAAQYLYEHGIPAYAYSTEIPVAVLGAKYQWARGAGLL
jgi:acyl-CoA synthetase (NDP forming)